MKIKIGIAHTNRVVEIEAKDAEKVVSAIERAFAEDHPIVWLDDADGTRYAIPKGMVAFFEVESPEIRSGVGFAAGV